VGDVERHEAVKEILAIYGDSWNSGGKCGVNFSPSSLL
jgi:hypothetical protein